MADPWSLADFGVTDGPRQAPKRNKRRSYAAGSPAMATPWKRHGGGKKSKPAHKYQPDDDGSDHDDNADVDHAPPPATAPSSEQQAVIDEVVAGNNVLCIAKAGAGKSTASLQAARAFFARHGRRAILITYNTRLKNETRERIVREKLEDYVEAHSYHAAAARYFAHGTYTGGADDGLIYHALQCTPAQPLEFGLVVIDEAQDMNALYARFVQHLLKHCAQPPQLLLVGDPFQRIFGFNGATTDFLTQPDAHFGPLLARQGAFVQLHLSVCWRITHEMAEFINDNLNPCNLKRTYPDWWREHGATVRAWWGPGIRANPARSRAPKSVRVVHGWAAPQAVHACQRMFARFGNDGVALLAHSLKNSRSPLHLLVDKLGKRESENWLILDGNTPVPETFVGKRVASTVHRFKGLERDGVLVCGVDAFVERLHTSNPLDHFNLWYVACTRARQQLVINTTGSPYATLRNSPKFLDQHFRTDCSLAKLVEYVPFDEVLSVHSTLFAPAQLFAAGTGFALERSDYLLAGREHGTVEDVRPFLATAIKLHFMMQLHNGCHGFPRIAGTPTADKLDADLVAFADRCRSASGPVPWPALVKYAVAYHVFLSQYKHYWRQLKDAFGGDGLAGTEGPLSTTPALEALWKRLDTASYHLHQLLWTWACHHERADPTDVVDETQRARLRELVTFDLPVSVPFGPAWFAESFSPDIHGRLDLVLDGHVVVGLSCADALEHELCLKTCLGDILLHRQLQLTQRPPPLVLLVCAGKLFQLNTVFSPSLPEHVTRDFELIHRSARRKLHLPHEAALMQHDFARYWKDPRPPLALE